MKKFISKSGDDYAVINLLINYITQQYFKGKSTQPRRWWACSIDFMSTSHRHNIHVFYRDGTKSSYTTFFSKFCYVS